MEQSSSRVCIARDTSVIQHKSASLAECKIEELECVQHTKTRRIGNENWCAHEIITIRLDNEIVIVGINNSLCNHRVN